MQPGPLWLRLYIERTIELNDDGWYYTYDMMSVLDNVLRKTKAAYAIGVEQRETAGNLPIVGGKRNTVHGRTIYIICVVSPCPVQKLTGSQER